MTDTGRMNMHATFYGGPADGGELVLLEPIRCELRFPMSPLEALEVLDTQARAAMLVPNSVPARYRLDLVDGSHPRRDEQGRVRYLYVLPKPQPKEATADDRPQD